MNYIYDPAVEKTLREMWYGFNENSFDETGLKWTIEGEPYLTKVGKKFGNAAICFNGESRLTSGTITFGGDYSVDWNYSIEGFVTVTDTTANQCIVQVSNGTQKTGVFIEGGVFKMKTPSGTVNYTKVTPSAGQTYYFNLMYYKIWGTGMVHGLSINGGEQVKKESGQGDMPLGNYRVYLGGSDSGNYFKGMLDEVRVSNVNRDYATIPTSPFAADANTLSLMHFNL